MVQGQLVVATTRPETMLGDSAVAVSTLMMNATGTSGGRKPSELPLTDRRDPRHSR